MSASGHRIYTADESSEFAAVYKRQQWLHVRTGKGVVERSPLESMQAVWAGSNEATRTVIVKNFTIENAGPSSSGLTPGELFGGGTVPSSSFYCSCIAQTDPALVAAVLSSLLPFPDGMPPSMFTGSVHSQPVWLFLGQNTSATPMVGRSEHTDAVSHSGTWHYQLSGSKTWYIRKGDSEEWGAENSSSSSSSSSSSGGGGGKRRKTGDTSDTQICIECLPGDFLFINTRLWRHHTQLPPTAHAKHGLSASLARDFVCLAVALEGTTREVAAPGEDKEGAEEFTNLDGIYATRNVKKGEVVLRESELPDCSLPRSLQANCEVSSMLDEDGEEEGCLIARCNIKAGDFLAVPPSDDDDDDDDDDEEEEEEEEVEDEEEEGGQEDEEN